MLFFFVMFDVNKKRMTRRQLIEKTEALHYLESYKRIQGEIGTYTALEDKVTVEGTGAHGAIVPYLDNKGKKVAVKFFITYQKEAKKVKEHVVSVS